VKKYYEQIAEGKSALSAAQESSISCQSTAKRKKYA
jgi:hypothetical protein